jgi:hypothetical protein
MRIKIYIFFVNVWRKNIFDIYVTEYGTALTTILPILFLYIHYTIDVIDLLGYEHEIKDIFVVYI